MCGVEGLLDVLDEIGRRSDDPDADYIAYHLYGLEGMDEYPVLDVAAKIDLTMMTENARVGLANIKRLLGEE